MLRIGLLGAAAIAPTALIRPARTLPDVEVVAVAARDPERAIAFARRHRIGRVYRRYEGLLADPAIDAVYIPLPNALHAEWTIRALDAGKHVLVEKPFAISTAEATQMVTAAAKNGKVLLEGFAYLHHPLAQRLRDSTREIGSLCRVEADFLVSILRPGNIRWRPELGGGSLLDAGCYPISLVRWLFQQEMHVVRARAILAHSGVDRTIEAEFAAGEQTARIRASLRSRHGFRSLARLIGEKGQLWVLNPFQPSFGYLLVVLGKQARRVEWGRGEDIYRAQLRGFQNAIAGRDAPIGLDDATAHMKLIDAVHHAAGLGGR
ncbi:MAG: Gfo/Idh/MocA family oxidoreductase [Dehalococcoidia bacterium]